MADRGFKNTIFDRMLWLDDCLLFEDSSAQVVGEFDFDRIGLVKILDNFGDIESQPVIDR